jgi:hypothetical protein
VEGRKTPETSMFKPRRDGPRPARVKRPKGARSTKKVTTLVTAAQKTVTKQQPV